MLKKTLFLLILLFLLTGRVFAEQNNKFGIHLAQPHREAIEQAAELVNSNGGEWGYVTLVVQENDRNKQKWQDTFDQMRELRLIPIIRLATKPNGNNWKRPVQADAQEWVDFLDSLNWVVKKRYVILFNEPNHATEWGGEVDPKSFAEVSYEFASQLKKKNPDFFVMFAGFDSSAPQATPSYQDEWSFLQDMMKYKSPSEWEQVIDGWSSHAYPNPAFSGSPWDTGRKSIRGYQWELVLLKELGFQKNLPVFITETGWSDKRLSRETIASYFQTAYEQVWLSDDRIIAVTPFVLDYQGEPFTQFSWRKMGSDEFYPQYAAVAGLQKQKGDPEQIDRGDISFDFSKELVADSSFKFRLKLKNTGQAIWDKTSDYHLKLENFSGGGEYFFSDIKQIKPFEESEAILYLKTNSIHGKYIMRISLYKGEEKIIEGHEWSFEIVPLPSLTFSTWLFPKIKTEGNDFELQIFNTDEEVVFKKRGVVVKEGKGNIDQIQNITLGEKYRIVLLKPYYLPRQTFSVFKRDANTVVFENMLPLDMNKNGKWDWEDGGTLMRKLALFRLLLPF